MSVEEFCLLILTILPIMSLLFAFFRAIAGRSPPAMRPIPPFTRWSSLLSDRSPCGLSRAGANRGDLGKRVEGEVHVLASQIEELKIAITEQSSR